VCERVCMIYPFFSFCCFKQSPLFFRHVNTDEQSRASIANFRLFDSQRDRFSKIFRMKRQPRAQRVKSTELSYAKLDSKECNTKIGNLIILGFPGQISYFSNSRFAKARQKRCDIQNRKTNHALLSQSVLMSVFLVVW